METNPENSHDPEDLLKFENELLRLKLEVEHGMEQADTSVLSPEIENQWLQHIYNFEQHYKNGKRVKVYDAIDRPDFKRSEELSPANISEALKHLHSLMEEKGIVLDCACTYDDAIIYRFITEELFDYEMDDISIEGVVHHFIYEEFHPNHEYDLRRYAAEFYENLLQHEWDAEFSSHSFAETVFYKGKSYNNADISAIILAFQEDRSVQLEKFEIEGASFDVQKGEAKVRSRLTYRHENELLESDSEVTFIFELGYWYLNGFQLPTFDNRETQ